MTIITGTIVDSGSQALTGRLIVSLDAPLIDSTTTPDTVHLPATREFAITSGVVNIVLLESQTSNITYHFVFNTYSTSELFYLVDGALYSGPHHLHTDGSYYTGDTHSSESVLLNRQTQEQAITHIDFHAIVPNAVSVEFAALLPTGISTDQLDTAVRQIARLLVNDADYAAILRGGPRPQGEFNPNTYYQLDDQVSLDGSSYTWISPAPAKGIYPPNATYWQVNASRGATGTGTGGNNTAYNATTWDGQLDAPSRNAVRDVIELLATKQSIDVLAPLESPALTGLPTAPTQTTGNRSTRLATTAFVGAEIDAIGIVPVGAILAWVTGSAPSKWMICDGRAISRTVYDKLFAVIGIAFGSGNGTSTFNIPDLRGRVIMGLDNPGTAAGDAGRLGPAWGDLIGGNGGAEAPGPKTSDFEVLNYGLASPAAGFQNRVLISATSGTVLSVMQPTIALNHIIYTGV